MATGPLGHGATPTSAPATGLYDRRFAALLAIVFLGFASSAIIGPVLPVLVLELGGDAAIVGLVVALFSVPSVLIRPFLGRLIDHWSQWNVWFLGTLGLAVASLAYVLPSLWTTALIRLVHGTAWAGFNTGSNTTLARFAPSTRRAEAAGMLGLMQSVANMALPGVGLLLVGALGTSAAFLVAGGLATAACAVLWGGPFPRGPVVDPRQASSPQGGGLIERSALIPMAIEALWMGVNVLFFIFPPLFCEAKGIPVEDLAIYYPLVGSVLVATRLLIGPRLDGMPRHRPLGVAAVCAVVSLLVAAAAETLPVFILAGAIWAFATTFVSPIAMALAIERSHPERQGASMATYSLGYQIGFGIGSLAWGIVVSSFGYPAPFLIAAIPVAGLGAIAWRTWRDRAQVPQRTPP